MPLAAPVTSTILFLKSHLISFAFEFSGDCPWDA